MTDLGDWIATVRKHSLIRGNKKHAPIMALGDQRSNHCKQNCEPATMFKTFVLDLKNKNCLQIAVVIRQVVFLLFLSMFLGRRLAISSPQSVWKFPPFSTKKTELT